jgi:hypothetical protein
VAAWATLLAAIRSWIFEMHGRREIGRYAFGVVYDGFPGLGMTMHRAIFQVSGKALYWKRASKRCGRADGQAEWNLAISS